MSNSLIEWGDHIWSDPDGGQIILHGVIPTVVYPRELRPRSGWDGLGLLVTSEEIDVWKKEEEYEQQDPGINLTEAMRSGGLNSVYLERLQYIDGIRSGRFPDPEPRRLHRLAHQNNRPIFFIEPEGDDAEWVEYLETQAEVMTRPRKLIAAIWIDRKFKKTLRKIQSITSIPYTGEVGFQLAQALSATWWNLSENISDPELCKKRDKRFAARLRGSLANLKQHFSRSDVKLLVPHVQSMRSQLIQALDLLPEPETGNMSILSHMQEEE